jgi:hypothetical protein
MGNVTGEDETEYWLSVVGIRESLAQSEEDIAAGRTYGEADVRALLVDKRRVGCGRPRRRRNSPLLTVFPDARHVAPLC